MPRTDEAMRNGDISAEQAEAIADAASVNPGAEDELLRSAKRDDLGTLRKKAKQAKFSADRDPDARMRRVHARRSLRHWTDDEGAFHAHLYTTPEAGARLLAALKPLHDAAFHRARKDGRREAPDTYAADALDSLARGATDTTDPRDDITPSTSNGTRNTAQPPSTEPPPREAPNSPPGSPPSPPPGSPPGSPPATSSAAPPSSPQPTARSRPRATVHLNIDFAPLLRGQLQPGDICEIVGIGPISLSAARALLGDATIELILKKGNDIRSVVHYGRTVTTAQRHALEARDPVCIRPGCGRHHNLEIDHRDGWAITHETSLDQLGRLCPYEHDLKTHHGHTYSGGPGHWQWHTPNDPPAGEPAPDRLSAGDDVIDLRDQAERPPAEQPETDPRPPEDPGAEQPHLFSPIC